MLLKARIAGMIEDDMRVAGPIQVTPGRCRLAALVGPTGVGKTTTIAKLAANFRLKEKRRVGLITVDTYRIAAVEQLRTYADIIDLPMHVVSTPREMRETVERMSHLDLILLDTAGRSPKDEVRIQELKMFLTEAAADEVHLVLSSVAAARTLEETAEQFSAVGATSLILTKLDEASGLGTVLPLLRSSGLPLSYLTDGQNVPDDIEIADRPSAWRADPRGRSVGRCAMLESQSASPEIIIRCSHFPRDRSRKAFSPYPKSQIPNPRSFLHARPSPGPSTIGPLPRRAGNALRRPACAGGRPGRQGRSWHNDRRAELGRRPGTIRQEDVAGRCRSARRRRRHVVRHRGTLFARRPLGKTVNLGQIRFRLDRSACNFVAGQRSWHEREGSRLASGNNLCSIGSAITKPECRLGRDRRRQCRSTEPRRHLCRRRMPSCWSPQPKPPR